MRALLVDANNLLMRGVWATKHASMTADGVSTAGLVVFIKTLAYHVRQEEPTHVAVCWDGRGGSTFRQDLDADYKGHRPEPVESFDIYKRDSRSLAKEFLALAGVHQVERPGFEADDLIAGYWHQVRTPGWETQDKIVILSSDKDFLQLVNNQTEQVRLSSAGTPTDRWDKARVMEKYGCLPVQLPLVMALTGDVSDNIPGINGIGPKTAVKILDKALWDLDLVTDPRVVAAREQVDRALQMVSLLEAPQGLLLPSLPTFQPTRPEDAMYEGLLAFLQRYRLRSIRDRVVQGALWHEKEE